MLDASDDYQLTKNFRYSEFFVHEDIPDELEANVQRLASSVLQPIRDILGVPMTITSSYRSPSRNAAVGGVDNSQHESADAADFTTPLSHDDVYQKLRAAQAAKLLPTFGQIIFYEDTGHIHASVKGATKTNEFLFSTGYENGARVYVTVPFSERRIFPPRQAYH